MASAYVALISLSSNIDLHLQNISLIFPDKFQIEFIKQKTTFLLQFFEQHHNSHIRSKEILDLDIRTKYVATEADCMIDCHAMDQNLMLIKHGYISENNSSKLFPDEAIHRIIKEFESIQEKATEIIKDIKANEEAQQSTLVPPSSPSRSSPGRLENNTTMIGFEKHLLRVMERITVHASNLQIIPILGMGGIGKSTLAQSVYDSQLVKEYFDIRLWATVSQPHNMHDILLSFMHDLNIVQSPPSEIHDIGDKLYKTLFGRRYLIVMDDIWDDKVWDEIGRFFPKNDNGSRIILTTRLLGVASRMGSCDPYKLEYLDEDESWNLLERKVFVQGVCPGTLEDVGRRIAISCKGLPLAIVVIAGHLAKSDMTKESWENVAGALVSTIHFENDSQCLKILSLSYDNLPLYLKPCFLYMAFFRKGSQVWASHMIDYWVANGLLKPIRDKCLEDTAMEYLTDLVERNLISVSQRGSRGKIQCFRIHDLLYDLCQWKSVEQKFLIYGIIENDRTLGMETNSEYGIPLSRFSVRYGNLDLSNSDWANEWAHRDADYNLLDFRLRRIVLSSSEATNISTFSASLAKISMFQNLQTLFIRETPGNEPFVLPPDIWDMALLRRLLINQVALPDPPTAETHDLINRGNCVLANLQTLQDVYCFKLSEVVVKRIPHLKKLKITYAKVSESTVEWSYYGLHNLAQLCMLESLSFSVCGKISALDFSLPQSLRKLSLDGCKFPWEEMALVGSLPNLEVLRLQNDAFCGREWKPVEGEFCHLKVLQFRNMSFQEWKADSRHFPRLEKLSLYNVWRLKEVPLDIGDIATLKFISAEYCRSSLRSSVSRLIAEQRSLENNSIEVELPRSFSVLVMDSLVPAYQSILLHSNNHPPNETSAMIEKFEDNLHELQTFLSYTTKKERTGKRLNELVKHIRDVMYEAVDLIFNMLLVEENGKSMNYWFRRILNVVKEVEYVAVKVQRLRLCLGDGWDEEEFGPNTTDLRDLIDWKTDDEAYNFRLRQLIIKHIKKRDPDSLEGNKFRVQVILQYFAVLTDVDGISIENELDQDQISIVHNASCDYCEKFPIVGVRYRCKDCTEPGGFDLCEECYSSGLVSDHTGGDNGMNHTSEHEFEIITSPRAGHG